MKELENELRELVEQTGQKITTLNGCGVALGSKPSQVTDSLILLFTESLYPRFLAPATCWQRIIFKEKYPRVRPKRKRFVV